MNAHRSLACARILAVSLIATLPSACGRSPLAQEAGKTPAAGPPIIDVVRVVAGPLDVTVEMPGQLDPFEEVAVFPRVTGFVKNIRVDRGSPVRAGELLAELEAPELLAQRAEAESKVQAAEAQLGVARARADADDSTFEKIKAAAATPGVVAGNDVVLAEKSVEADQGQIVAAARNVDAAQQALNSIRGMEAYLRITAPFAGVITERNVHVGALVGPNSGGAPGTPMLRIVNRDRLRLVVPVPEAYIAGVAAGAQTSFTVPAYPGESFTARVARVADAVDVKTRTMAVELDVSNSDGRLSPGSFCQVRWTVHRPGPSLVVPNTSVTSTTGRTFVVRVRNGKTEWVDVKTGHSAGPLIEVFGDLSAGDEIAVRGTDEIRAGTEVRSKNAAAGS